MAKKKVTKKRPVKKDNYEERMRGYEREARQRSAWAWYGQQMSHIRAQEERTELIQAAERGDSKKVNEITDRIKGRNNNLVIM